MKGRTRRATLVAVLAGSAASVAQAQSISTGIQNNGTGGIFINLTPSGTPLHFNSFATYWTGTDTIEVWTRPGSYVGFDGSNAGWTQSQIITGAVGAGSGTLATVTLTTPVLLPAGQTTAIYLQPTSGGGFNYTTGDATHPTTFSNADVTLFSDVARTGLVVFGGTRNSPRVFAGTIFYSLADPALPGACCHSDGTCSGGTLGDCQAVSGVFQGQNSTCGTVTCPQPGACCLPSGTCSFILASACTLQGGTFQGAAVACASVNCNGACCNPDGTCSSIGSGTCTSGGGIFNGLGSTCAGVTCFPFFGEVEPNETRPTATSVNFTAAGQVIRGTTTGTSATAGATSLDQFLIKTPPAAAGIYRHRLAITTSGTAGHVGTIRGLTQAAAASGPWPGPVGTATATDTAAQTTVTTAPLVRTNQWYGFGKEEQIYYRVTGGTTTTAPYTSTLSTDPITATDIPGTFQAGTIALSSFGQGHTTNTEFWVYDSSFNAIDGYGNDDESVAGGSPGTGATGTSFLRREYPAGTYYIAVSNFALTNNKGSPCDDDLRTGAMLDFPHAALNSTSTTGVNVAFAVTDSAGTSPISATRPGQFDVLWYRMTVTGTVPSGSCCTSDGNCVEVTEYTCRGQGGVFQGAGTVCASTNCPQPGACCLFTGCTFVLQSACTGTFVGGACAAANCPTTPPVFFNNCNLPTGTTTLSGVAAPAGAQWSECARDEAGTTYANTNAGFNINPASFREADDFVIPAGGRNVGYLKFATYQTGATALSMTSLTLRILNGPPNDPGSQVVFGDTTTNRLSYVEFAPIYRTFNTVVPGTCGGALTAPDQTRHIQWTYAAVNQFLPAGTYWFDLGGTGSVASGPWLAVATDADAVGRQCTGSNSNAMTFTVASSTWAPVTDTGQPLAGGACAAAPVLTQDLYFEVLGTTPTPNCYPNCDGSTQVPVLNVADFTCFLTKFAAGDAYANCDGSTQIPVLNVADFTCFLTKFAAGCSAP
jgi:hypothetical protein